MIQLKLTMVDIKFKKNLEEFIEAELEGNIFVLIDPKKKDSFSASRVYTWKKLVSERILQHIDLHLEK